MSVIIRIGTPDDIAQALNLVKELAVYEKAPNEVEVTVEEMTNWGFGKDKQFDFFVYPDRNHSMAGGKGNARLHLYTKLTNFLLENL